MAHRNYFSTSNISEMDRDQVRNSFNPEPHLPLENGSLVFPVNNVVVNAVNAIPYPNVPLRSNDYPSSSMEIPHYRSTTSGNCDLHQHLPAASNSSFMPSTYLQQGPNNHILNDEGRNLNPLVDSGRGLIKRKSPSSSMFSDTGSANWYSNSGSSSNMTVSADHLQPKPLLSSHQQYWDPNRSVHTYNGNDLLISGEVSQRNVRSRRTNTPHLGTISVGTHFSNNLPCHFPQVGDFPGPSINGQWCQNPTSYVSHRWVSGASGLGHINQSFASSTARVSAEPSGSHHHNAVPIRHLGAPLPVFNAPSQSAGEGQNNSRQRVGPSHRSTTCYPNLLCMTTTSEEVGQSGSGPGGFSRNSRPLAIGGGRNVERNRRPRFSYGRFQPYSDGNGTRGRWMSEGVVMMDQSAFYDSVNLFDQHRDMRLDIDDMGYEELLALEERIGNVNTGLSEDLMSKCLTETTYCPSDQDLEERSCVICLEHYEDKDELGLLKCGHYYHVECIKKWLLTKNVCPICKASALEETSTD